MMLRASSNFCTVLISGRKEDALVLCVLNSGRETLFSMGGLIYSKMVLPGTVLEIETNMKQSGCLGRNVSKCVKSDNSFDDKPINSSHAVTRGLLASVFICK